MGAEPEGSEEYAAEAGLLQIEREVSAVSDGKVT